jgi:hypothetical protein
VVASLLALLGVGAFVVAVDVSASAAMPAAQVTSVIGGVRSGQVYAPPPSARPGKDSTARLVVSLIIAALFAVVVLGALWLLWGMAQRP